MPSIVSIQWLVPLAAVLDLGVGGGDDFVELTVPCPDVLVEEDDNADLAANFSFLAFCTQSGQVTSLAFAD
jgi:hypothetical protein